MNSVHAELAASQKQVEELILKLRDIQQQNKGTKAHNTMKNEKIEAQQRQINKLEAALDKKAKKESAVRHTTSLPGIGENRFVAEAKKYAVETKKMSDCLATLHANFGCYELNHKTGQMVFNPAGKVQKIIKDIGGESSLQQHCQLKANLASFFKLLASNQPPEKHASTIVAHTHLMTSEATLIINHLYESGALCASQVLSVAGYSKPTSKNSGFLRAWRSRVDTARKSVQRQIEARQLPRQAGKRRPRQDEEENDE